MISNKVQIQTLLEILKAKGVQHVVVSPGSRNAPISVSLHAENFKTYVITDERSAAFFALGIAMQQNHAVAIVCTSGSALLNYAPAVAEAYYQRVPLIVISADRPTSMVDQADGQTIRQQRALQNHLVHEVHLPETINDEQDAWYCNRLINEAINSSMGPVNGPVHINMPLREPLYELQKQKSSLLNTRTINHFFGWQSIGGEQLEVLKSIWKNSSKKLLLVGQLPVNHSMNRVIEELLKDSSVVVLAETTSNLPHHSVIQCIDNVLKTIRPEELTIYQPDLVVSFGGMVISKVVKQFIRKSAVQNHWHVDEASIAPDTFFQLTHHLQFKPNYFLNHFINHSSSNSDYQKSWLTRYKFTNVANESYTQNAPWSDFKAFSVLASQLQKVEPKAVQIHSANSSVIRYLQLFTYKHGLAQFCNRGTSGIDGSTSTALGASTQFKGITLFVSGDLSFMYDSNALWNKYLHSNFRVLLINNGGGGIFRIIDGPKNAGEPLIEQYLEAHQPYEASKLCAFHGIEHQAATTETQLAQQLEWLLDETSSAARLVEVFTPRLENSKVLTNYFEYLKGNVG